LAVPRRIRGSGGQYLARRVFWALVCLWGTTALGQAPSGRYITLEWDPSPDPTIVGYIVYVGTAPRRYTESYVVRSRTYFVYPNAVPEQRYYFAVAAYAGGPLMGPLIGVPSEEVSGFGQSTSPRPLEDPRRRVVRARIRPMLAATTRPSLRRSRVLSPQSQRRVTVASLL
jgi:hypothetical protein